MKDQNSINLAWYSKNAQEVYDFIMKNVGQVKRGNTTVATQGSNLDEIKNW